MAQFYFLSILFNVAAGLILVYGSKLSDLKQIEEKEVQVKKNVKKSRKKTTAPEEEAGEGKGASNAFGSFKNAPFLNDRTMRLVIGVLCGFVGLMKLLSVFKGDVPVVGDIIPAVAGLLAGASLILEYYMNTTTEPLSVSESVVVLLVDSRKYIGLFCLLAAVLHFIFPGVLLL